MNPVEATAEQIEYWRQRDDGFEGRKIVLGGPHEGDGVMACPALITAEVGVIHVAYKLNEIDLAQLANGGTLWLTTFGPLPVHLLDVEPSAIGPRPDGQRDLTPNEG